MSAILKSVTIDNFKSLRDCTIGFNRSITCFVGLNGSGKSTVLQALSFLAAIMQNNVSGWLDTRHWLKSELKSKLSAEYGFSGLIRFNIVIEADSGREIYWDAKFNVSELKCTEERIYSFQPNQSNEQSDPVEHFWVKGSFWGTYKDNKLKRNAIIHRYEGSILASLKDDLLDDECTFVRDVVSSLKSMDLLNPISMRSGSRKTKLSDIGDSGENIASFLNTFSFDTVNSKITPQLQKFFSTLIQVSTKKKRFGWVELNMKEHFQGADIEFNARHCNDGMLRILGIVSELQCPASILCFDEIENGISIDICSLLVRMLEASGKQIIITTHNMLLVNWLHDECMRLVFKNDNGATKICRFADIPSVKEHLELLGAGDAILYLTLSQVSSDAKKVTK